MGRLARGLRSVCREMKNGNGKDFSAMLPRFETRGRNA